MPTATRIIRNTYRDSVALMQLSARIAALDGIRQASVVMATEGNLALLREAGLVDSPLEAAPGDLLVVAQGEIDQDVQTALEMTVRELAGATAPHSAHGPRVMDPRSLRMGLEVQPGANLALISTPGEYAAAEALKALRFGLNVMLFSDNVGIAEEAALKREASERGLLVMGPDCGTAIIGGIPLGFANAVLFAFELQSLFAQILEDPVDLLD
jgi:succinyl-CoA synthetase alpha subunit